MVFLNNLGQPVSIISFKPGIQYTHNLGSYSCRNTPLLSKEDLGSSLEAIPAWKLNAESTQISRSFVAKNFVAAINFFQHVAEVAEEANHHPDLHLTGWRNVEVGLSLNVVLTKSEFCMCHRSMH